jgi:hypothetical protein
MSNDLHTFREHAHTIRVQRIELELVEGMKESNGRSNETLKSTAQKKRIETIIPYLILGRETFLSNIPRARCLIPIRIRQ